MPYHDDEYPGQPLWQSVMLFCCKGMIEVIMVLLFFWLLIQVLFTKQIEVHLQVLLIVGLVVFSLCLLLGCFLCWRMRNINSVQDKEPVASPLVDPAVTPAQDTTAHTAKKMATSVVQLQCEEEELDGDEVLMEFPSTFSSPAPSTPASDDFSTATRTFEFKEHPRSYFPLRRLSSPCTAMSPPLYKPSTASFPSLSRLGLLSKVLERRRTVTGDDTTYSERSRLTGGGATTPSVPDIPLATLHYGSTVPAVPVPLATLHSGSTIPDDPVSLATVHYGSSVPEAPVPLTTVHYGSTVPDPPVPLQYVSSFRQPGPSLDFTLAFSLEQGALTVRMLCLTRTTHRLEEVSVLGSLAPLCPCPVQASACLGPETSSPVLMLRVGSVEELRRCVLRLAVYTRVPPSQRGSPLGEVEVQCGGMDWSLDQPLHVTKELSPNKWKLKKSLTSQDASTGHGLSCMPQAVGQLFILLQYQTLAHRLKTMVLRADNLGNLTHMPHAPDYQVVIILRHKGTVIGTRETRGVGGANTVWNSPCHFDLPPGDVTQLPLMLEFIVMQNQVHSKSAVLGQVLIGPDAPEAGRIHWRDVCSQGQIERARWHTVQPQPL